MKLYQQNIFGGEDEVLTQLPVYVWQNKVSKKYWTGQVTDQYVVTDDYNLAVWICHKEYRLMTKEEITNSVGHIHKSDAFELVVIWLPVGQFNKAAIERGMKPYGGMTI